MTTVVVFIAIRAKSLDIPVNIPTSSKIVNQLDWYTKGSLEWLARSPDLTSLDFLLLKAMSTKSKPYNLGNLKRVIIITKY